MAKLCVLGALIILTVIIFVNSYENQVKVSPKTESGLICYCPCPSVGCTGYDIVTDEVLDIEDLKSGGYEPYVPTWDPKTRRMR